MASKRKLIREIAAIISTSKNRADKLAYYIVDKVLEWKLTKEEVGKDGDVLEFIRGFNRTESNNVLMDTFTKGYCYYFSVILRERFPGGKIVYAPIRGHFLYKIKGKLYDITGEVEVDIYHDFDFYPDYLEKERIIRDCILKVEPIYPPQLPDREPFDTMAAWERDIRTGNKITDKDGNN